MCFALALHDLSESPFRAMDEFDVFMVSRARHHPGTQAARAPLCEPATARIFVRSTTVAWLFVGADCPAPVHLTVYFLALAQDSVNRKLSLQTVVDFAVKHKSQWMFITPHDIRYALRC